MTTESDSGRPWYAEGLRFQCTQCGNCCSGGPGAVWFTPEEADGMARALGVSVEVFLERYTRRIGAREEVDEQAVDQLVGLAEVPQRRAARVDQQRLAIPLHQVLAERGRPPLALGQTVEDPGLLRGWEVIDIRHGAHRATSLAFVQLTLRQSARS